MAPADARPAQVIMTKSVEKPFPVLELIPAEREQEPIIANLLELYIHDFSEFNNCELGEDGRFGYRRLPLYWNEPGRHPFLVRIDGKLAGVVLIASPLGIWPSSLFFAHTGGAELERT
jgi:hypothetical protein